MKRLLLSLMLAVAAAAGAEEKMLRISLDDPAVRKAVAACPGAKLEKDVEANRVLTVEVSPGAPGKWRRNIVKIPVDLSRIGVAGHVLFGEADICFTDVSKPAKNFNGVKFQLELTDGDGGVTWPGFRNRSQGWGTSGWTRARGRGLMPEKIRSAVLELGLQGSSGKVSFRNIRFFRGGAAPVSTLELPVIPQAEYTVDPPRQRGVMSPFTTKPPCEQDFADLAAWGANSIRWQLGIPLVAGKIPTAAQVRKYLDGKIAELGQVLAFGQKYGIRVTVDLHSTSAFSKGLLLGTAEGRELTAEFWEKVAKRYAGHPALFGYDLINEPHSREIGPGDPALNEQYAHLIGRIRRIDPVTPIIVECDEMSNPAGLPFLPVFDAPNIIYSIHMYRPHELTHQLDRNASSRLGYPDAARKWDKELLRRELAVVREFQRRTGARIYVGEFGCIRWAPGAAEYLRDCIDLFEEYGWDWCYHAFREFQGWSVELGGAPDKPTPEPDNDRKRVLLEGLKRNRE